MITRTKGKLAAVAGGLALSALAGAGIASADVLSEQAIDTTCNYGQVIRALDAQEPGAGQKVSNGPAGGFLQNYLNSPREQRIQMAQQAEQQYGPLAVKYMGRINAVAATCNSF